MKFSTVPRKASWPKSYLNKVHGKAARQFDGLPFFMPLLLFLLFLRVIPAPAIRGAEQAVMLLSNKHFPAILAHVDRIIRICEHEAEYQRDCQHQGMKIPYQGRRVVKQRNAVGTGLSQDRSR